MTVDSLICTNKTSNEISPYDNKYVADSIFDKCDENTKHNLVLVHIVLMRSCRLHHADTSVLHNKKHRKQVLT